MKESYQREEYSSDQRKGSLRHFQPSEEPGVKLQGREAPRVVIRSQFIGLLTKTAISLKTPAGRILSVIAISRQSIHPGTVQALSFTDPLLIFSVLEVKLSCEMKCAEVHLIFP